MIVCEIYGKTAVKMSGHANTGDEIICAGASALVNALVESIELVAGIPDDEIEISLSEGDLRIDLGGSANRISDALLGYFETGMLGLARTYPASVKVIRRNYENSKL